MTHCYVSVHSAPGEENLSRGNPGFDDGSGRQVMKVQSKGGGFIGCDGHAFGGDVPPPLPGQARARDSGESAGEEPKG